MSWTIENLTEHEPIDFLKDKLRAVSVEIVPSEAATVIGWVLYRCTVSDSSAGGGDCLKSWNVRAHTRIKKGYIISEAFYEHEGGDFLLPEDSWGEMAFDPHWYRPSHGDHLVKRNKPSAGSFYHHNDPSPGYDFIADATANRNFFIDAFRMFSIAQTLRINSRSFPNYYYSSDYSGPRVSTVTDYYSCHYPTSVKLTFEKLADGPRLTDGYFQDTTLIVNSNGRFIRQG